MTDRTAWCAGFFDGEGCITFGRINGYIRIFCTIGQRVQEPLLIFKEEFGGGVSLDKKGLYHYQLTGPKAGEMLERLLPHLVVKKGQAELAIEWCKLRAKFLGSPEMDAMEAEIKALKKPWLRVVND